MLQRTDADTVAPIYKAFLISYPTVSELAIANLENIAELLQPLGLFFRAERLLQTAKIVKDKYDGRVPQEEKELLKLPGIGKYTARAILSQVYDKPAAVMDTNVARIIEFRIGPRRKRYRMGCAFG